MRIQLNGEPFELPDNQSVADLLVRLDLTGRRVAVELNLDIVPRSQHDSTQRLMFPFARLISYLSTWTTLMPGDVIATGTPTGAGVRMDPPRFLAAGDVVEVEVSGVGLLRNPVADERPA